MEHDMVFELTAEDLCCMGRDARKSDRATDVRHGNSASRYAAILYLMTRGYQIGNKNDRYYTV
jgi:hypothetical protein